MKLAPLLFKLLVRLGQLLSDDVLRDLVNVNVTFGQLFGELLAELIAFPERRRLGVFQDGPVFDHLVLMVHHTSQILGRKKHKVGVIPGHLLLSDAGLTRHQVQQLIRLLP